MKLGLFLFAAMCLLLETAAAQGIWSPTDLAVLTRSAAASSYALTNYAGCVAWYDPEIAPPSTNGSVVTLPDLAWYGFNLTNASATSTWPIRQASGLNGKATLLSAGKNLRNAILAANQPVDVFLVAAITNKSVTIYFDSHTSATPMAFYNQSPNLVLTAGTVQNVVASANLTNRFLVFNAIFDSANTKLLTNNVSTGTYSAGANNMNGFTLGANRNIAFVADLEIATVAIFTNLSSGDRTSVFSALTNRYNLQ